MQILNSYEVVYDRIVIANEKHNFAPTFFLETRKLQLDIILHFHKIEHHVDTILEVGSGIPLASALLSRFCRLYLSTDLLHPETIYGAELDQRKNLVQSAGVENVKIVVSDAQYMGIKDSSIDLIFNSSVLEHIEDLDKCIREMNRVLKEGGVVINVVPNFSDVIYRYASKCIRTPFWILRELYKELLKRREPGETASLAERQPGEKLYKYAPPPGSAFLERVLNRFIGPSHGQHYSSIWDEFKSSFPGSWYAWFEKQGFIIGDAFSIRYHYLMDITPSKRFNLLLYKLLVPLIRVLGGRRLLKYMGTAFCFVARKP